MGFFSLWEHFPCFGRLNKSYHLFCGLPPPFRKRFRHEIYWF
jgi:hypothetical protein